MNEIQSFEHEGEGGGEWKIRTCDRKREVEGETKNKNERSNDRRGRRQERETE